MRRILDGCPFLDHLSAASEIQAGFLNLGAIDILGWIMICGGGGCVSARMHVCAYVHLCLSFLCIAGC